MKKALIATILAMFAGSAAAVTPSFDDNPEHHSPKIAAGVAGTAASSVGHTAWPLPAGANY